VKRRKSDKKNGPTRGGKKGKRFWCVRGEQGCLWPTGVGRPSERNMRKKGGGGVGGCEEGVMCKGGGKSREEGK